jgi:hypothetical protein
VRTLFERNARRTHRASADAEVRAVVRGLEPTLMRYAVALRGAGRVGLIQLPQEYRNDLPDPSPLIDLADGPRSQTRAVSVARLGYRFPGVAWGDDAGTITVRVSGTTSSAVAMIGTFFRRDQDGSGSVTFRIDGETAGQATLILINASRGARGVTITASH